jgi:hypothetical protein
MRDLRFDAIGDATSPRIVGGSLFQSRSYLGFNRSDFVLEVGDLPIDVT